MRKNTFTSINFFFNFLHNKTKRHNHSYPFVCFNNEEQNVKKFKKLKDVDLRYNNFNKKVEIYIDNQQLITNGQNDFSLNNLDLCFLIKLEFLRNKKEANVLTMPVTLIINNLIDFLSLKKKGDKRKTEDSTITKRDNIDPENKKQKHHGHSYSSGENNSLYFDKLKKDSSGRHFSEEQLCGSKDVKSKSKDNWEVGKLEQEKQRSEQKGFGNGFKKTYQSDYCSGNGDVSLFSGKNFISERKLMENKIFENFLNDLVFYTAEEKTNSIISEKEKYSHDFIKLPESINYLKDYKIANLNEEQKFVYNKYIKIFEDIHKIKLKKAKHFETPTQEESVNQTIWNLIKDVYRSCNLEYIYQFYRWGYVFDVNIVKDSSALLMLSSLFLIQKLLIPK